MNRSTFNGVMMPLGGTKQVHKDISVCLIAWNRNHLTFHFASFPIYLHCVIVQSFLYFSPAPAFLHTPEC